MMRFFRNVRQMSLKKGKFIDYFIYASGEIILVVIGILIALQFNTYHQRHIDKKLEQYYLAQIRDNLVADSLLLYEELAEIERRLPVIENLLTELNKENNKSSFNEAFREYINSILVPLSFVSNRATYSEMESNGQLIVIRDKEIRNEIVTLYINIEKMENTYRVNYEFMQPIDAELIYGKGIAKYQKYQNTLFSPYLSEDELYDLKNIKAVLESNIANWNCTILYMQPVIASQLDEVRSMIVKIDQYLDQD